MTKLPPRPRPLKKPALSEVWEQLRPGTPPPRFKYTLPFMGREKTDRLFLGLLVRLVKLENFKEEMFTSPTFIACIFFSFAGYYTTLRAYYKDQFWTYGVRQQLPGVAHQIQEQRFTTFQQITAPTAVEKARQLGIPVSESLASESPVVQFLETPFLKRLDMYPNAALLEMTPQWSTMVGDNYTTRFCVASPTIATKYDRARQGLRFGKKRPATSTPGQDKSLSATVIPVYQTFSSVNALEYQPRHILRRLDPWADHRLLFDLADEVPTRLDESFKPAVPAVSKPSNAISWLRDWLLPPAGPVALALPPDDLPTLPSKGFGFQTESVDEQPLMYGIPFASTSATSRDGEVKLPAYMVDVSETTKAYRPRRRRYRDKNGQPYPKFKPVPSSIYDAAITTQTDSPYDRIAAFGWDKKSAKERKKLPLVSYPFPDDALGFSPSMPTRRRFGVFDSFGMTLKELLTPVPGPMPEPPQPPVGYEDYRRRREIFPTKKDKNPLVAIMRRETNLLKFPAKTRDQIEALREYRRAMEVYRTQKLEAQAAERAYAPIRRKFQELQAFWKERLPQALLARIQAAPLTEVTKSWLTLPEEHGEGEVLIPDLFPGALDWYAHKPMSRQDWHFIMRILNVRGTPRALIQFPLWREEATLDDTRKLVEALFDRDFTKPYHMFAGELSEGFLKQLDMLSCRRLGHAELDTYEDFYTILANKGLSKGPSARYLKDGLPTGLLFSNELRPASTYLDEPEFYQPFMDWCKGIMKFGPAAADNPIRFPEGFEFHWAVHANHFVQTFSGRDFVEKITPDAGRRKLGYFKNANPIRFRAFFDEGGSGLGETLRQKVLSATETYIRSAESAGLSLEAARIDAPEVDNFLTNLHIVTNFRRTAQALFETVQHEGSVGALPSYSKLWSRPQPQMDGFLFPDTDRERLRHQLQMSRARYNLGSKSLWEAFEAVTSVRPMEILLPPGYRLFVSRTMPDFTRPRPTDYRQVKVFPKYEVPRRPSLLPAYDVLKKHYPDLDVSFLPDKPKPRLRTPRSFLDIESDDPVTIGLGPYSNYFEYPKTLASRNGELDMPASALHWIRQYYLGAQNWIKDMPRNFLGFQGFTRGDIVPPFLRKIQREQVKTYSTAYEKTLFAGPEPELRLPSQLEDGTMFSIKRDAKLVEAGKEGFFKKKAYPIAKHTAQLEAYQIFTLPQLSLDEWHMLFTTSLDRARLTGEPILNLDIPPIQPVVYHRPSVSEGMIHVDPLASEAKQRTQALAQILFLASEPKLGAYNIPDYVNPRALDAANPPPTPGTERRILPIVWHYTVPRLNAVNTLPGVRQFYNWQPSQNLTNVAPNWQSADEFVAKQKAQANPIARFIAAFTPTEVLGIEPEFRTYEPVTIYSWFLFSQFLIIPFVLKLTNWVKFIVIRDFYIELHYRVFPIFASDPYIAAAIAKSLRECYRWTGQIPDKPFRVFKGIKRRFTDIVGIEPDVLSRSGEIALSLRNRGRGGPASPKGVLLYGPPGNGKTFLVQAIAGEADVPLVALTTSELLDKRRHSSAVDGLVKAFKLARKLSPCILFIDEIDGLGMKRSSMLLQEAEAPNPENNFWAFARTVPPRTTLPFVTRGKLNKAYVDAANANPFKAQKELRERSMEGLLDRKRYNFDTEEDFRPEFPIFEPPAPRKLLSPTGSARIALVTAFLTLMDHLRPEHGIVVIGATNRISVLDPAVRRSGRLDLHVAINAPSEERRIEIMRYYISRLGLQEEIPWDYMADRTRAYSIADLETMVNQSAMIAILRDEQHTLASLEDAMEATARHRHIRANRIPYPIVKTLPKHDPLFFLRISYYQASRALVHNILPNHPTLPFVQMQLEPFAPEVPIAQLIRRPYTLQDLEDRLAAMLAGKAGEFLLLYGSPLKSQEELNERQLFESNLGVEEIGYATDLAYAIVDQWLLIDDFTLPIRKALKLETGQNDEMFFEPGGDPGRPHFLRYNLEDASRLHGRTTKLHTSMFDRKYRVNSSFVDTLRWFAETKASMNIITEAFVQWSRLFTPHPFKRNVWEPVEQYYANRPYFKVTDSTPPSPDEEITEPRVRPTFPDLARLDRDYLMQAVMVKCFNNALELLEQHRTVLDRMAQHLLRKKKLRSFEMHEYIAAYTAELRAVDPGTKVRSEPQKGEMPDLRTKPQSRIQVINGQEQLVIDQSWGPESLKPGTKNIPSLLFEEGKKAPVWAEMPITFDFWRQPTQEGDYLNKANARLQAERDQYAARYEAIRRRYHDLYKGRIGEFDAIRDERDRFMSDLLLAMVPPLEAYLRRLADGKGGSSPGGASPPPNPPPLAPDDPNLA